MKKLYIISSSWDSHSDHYKVNELVCSSLFFAENKKIELENKYRGQVPFLFDWCTKDEFEDLLNENKALDEDIQNFIDWEQGKSIKETFNCCFINEIDFYEMD